MLRYEKALARVKENVPRPEEIQLLPLLRARGKILAENIISDNSFPPFPRSNMDGFAVRAEDVETAPKVLKCIGESRAGLGFSGVVGKGEAVSIMTGAPIPEGADTVIMVEETREVGEEVHILTTGKKGQFISPAGECLQGGEVGLEKGRYLRSYEIGILAALGKNEVPVFQPPRVSILTTGDELVEVSQKPGPGQVRNSNAYSLSAHVSRIGGLPRVIATAKDDLETLVENIKEGLEDEFLLLSGGVSMGKYDLVKDALHALGVEFVFSKVAVKPGKPTVFGRKGTTLVFGLPGNPVSTSVVFELLVKPAMLMRMGLQDYDPPRLRGLYKGPKLSSINRRFFLPAILSFHEKPWTVEKVSWKGSADIFSTGKANCLIEIFEDAGGIQEGDEVSLVPMEELFI